MYTTTNIEFLSIFYQIKVMWPRQSFLWKRAIWQNRNCSTRHWKKSSQTNLILRKKEIKERNDNQCHHEPSVNVKIEKFRALCLSPPLRPVGGGCTRGCVSWSSGADFPAMHCLPLWIYVFFVSHSRRLEESQQALQSIFFILIYYLILHSVLEWKTISAANSQRETCAVGVTELAGSLQMKTKRCQKRFWLIEQ